MLLRLSSRNKETFLTKAPFSHYGDQTILSSQVYACEFWEFLLLWNQKLFLALCEYQILFHFVFQWFFKPAFRWYHHINNPYSVENMRVTSLDLCIFIFVPLLPLWCSALWISPTLSSWTPSSISLHEGLEILQAVS